MSLQNGNTMKNKKKKAYTTLLTTYRDPTAPGSLGGVARFARAQKLPIGKVPAIGASRISTKPFKTWWAQHHVPSLCTLMWVEVQWLEIKSQIFCERSIIDGQGMEVIILNPSTFNIFRCARTLWTLLRRKCQRPQGS